ncbi:MAG: caspase family protein, partial [Pseudomonadota bacterium]
MPRKISMDTLYKKLVDPTIPEDELAKYFAVDPDSAAPFSPALTIDPSAVDIPDTPAGEARSAAVLNSANWVARMRRLNRYHEIMSRGTYKGPVIVSEGDSWFQYPFRLTDTIDVLLKDYAIMSLDAAGDTLDNMFAQSEHLDALDDTEASILLFSAGGNDLVAGGALASHLRDFDPALSPSQHLLPSFDQLLADAVGTYERILRDVGRAFPGVHTICHGYDYSIPAKGKWLGKPMEKRGIADTALQRAIAAEMVDRFNALLSRMAGGFSRVSFVDNRRIVTDRRWHDELHPTSAGYADVAARFKAEIEKVSKPRSRGKKSKSAPATLMTRKGRSLHLGLNVVDPEHYGGWDGLLAACEFDAEDMASIASDMGYDSTVLMSEEAKRDTVINEIKAAAKALEPGDIFFVSYAGHGGQIPDMNRDEEDATDETWCLYDAQLIDDELYNLWSLFKPDVRILVVSDSCHSGSVIRNMASAGQLDVDGTDMATGLLPRTMPPLVAAKTFRANRDLYTRIGRS